MNRPYESSALSAVHGLKQNPSWVIEIILPLNETVVTMETFYERRTMNYHAITIQASNENSSKQVKVYVQF